jgi:hypothetical protein
MAHRASAAKTATGPSAQNAILVTGRRARMAIGRSVPNATSEIARRVPKGTGRSGLVMTAHRAMAVTSRSDPVAPKDRASRGSERLSGHRRWEKQHDSRWPSAGCRVASLLA